MAQQGHPRRKASAAFARPAPPAPSTDGAPHHSGRVCKGGALPTWGMPLGRLQGAPLLWPIHRPAPPRFPLPPPSHPLPLFPLTFPSLPRAGVSGGSMGGKCRPGAWLVQGSPRPCAPLNVQCPSSPATSTPHPSCIAVCDGSVIDPRQTINCNANANAVYFYVYSWAGMTLPAFLGQEDQTAVARYVSCCAEALRP